MKASSNHAKSYHARLRILDDAVDMVARVHQLARQIGHHDRELKDQLAMCSGRESIMALRIAAAKGLVAPEPAATEADNLDRIVATLYKLAARNAQPRHS
jgi:hypothetical protein